MIRADATIGHYSLCTDGSTTVASGPPASLFALYSQWGLKQTLQLARRVGSTVGRPETDKFMALAHPRAAMTIVASIRTPAWGVWGPSRQ